MSKQADRPEVLELFHGSLSAVRPHAVRVRSTVGPAAEMDDLIAYGQAGLLDAARRFDPQRGVPFRAFASFRIRGAILDGVRQMANLPRRVHERLRLMDASTRFSEGLLEDSHAPAPPGQTPADIERRLCDHLAAMATAMATGLVAEAAVDDDGEATAASSFPSPEEASHQRQLLNLVQKGIEELPTQEATLIRRHYLEGERFDTVAVELGLSKSWASRLHSRAIERLTKRMKNFGNSPSAPPG